MADCSKRIKLLLSHLFYSTQCKLKTKKYWTPKIISIIVDSSYHIDVQYAQVIIFRISINFVIWCHNSSVKHYDWHLIYGLPQRWWHTKGPGIKCVLDTRHRALLVMHMKMAPASRTIMHIFAKTLYKCYSFKITVRVVACDLNTARQIWIRLYYWFFLHVKKRP